MKIIKRLKRMSMLIFVLVIMISSSISIATETFVNLGNAGDFAILSGQSITNTGTTTINGNVGLSPGSSFTKGDAVINGEVHINDVIAIQAKQDLTTAFNNAAGSTPFNTIPSELGGSTLTPGYYVSESGTFELTGILTLDAMGDANAVFVFKTTSSLITATSSQVNVINSAESSQVFWNVGSSATLGITSHFEGTIMAKESITLTTGATINGSLLALNGSVTLDSNTINTVVQPHINIEKTADKSVLSEGSDTVTYSYKISNLGVNDLENIVVNDDKISEVIYSSGDTNADEILQPSETWMYTGVMMIIETTTNIVTVSASVNNTVVIATDTFTVTVLPVDTVTEPIVTEPTVTEPVDTPLVGGELPQTATPLNLYLISGFGFMLLGLVGLKINKKI